MIISHAGASAVRRNLIGLRLTLEPGVFSLTGRATNLTRTSTQHRALSLAPATFTLTGRSTAIPGAGVAPVAGTKLADEHQQFLVAAPTRVRFGTSTNYVEKDVVHGGTASIDFFGGVDPAPQQIKEAISMGAAPITIVDPGVDGSPMPLGDAITDTNGIIIDANYRAIAAVMGEADGFTYLKGQPSDDVVNFTAFESVHTKFTPSQQPLADQSPDGLRTTWEKGGPAIDESGNYYSNAANAIFETNIVGNPGVNNFQQTAGGNNTMTTAPQISWIDTAGAIDGNMRSWFIPENVDVFHPIAMACAYGRPGWNMQRMIAFQSGVIANARSMNNAHNGCFDQLRAGLVPTSICVTNASEFALVACWDTIAVKGVIAFVALAGMPNGYTLNGPDNLDNYWGDWKQMYPGLQNLGNWAFAKVVGYLDLPSDMKAPTEIFATTGVSPWDTGYGGLTPQRETLNLDNAPDRALFQTGGTHNRGIAKTGMAVVISKSERKACFIDLKPLFAYYFKMYFGTPEDYLLTKNPAKTAGAWPFTFTEEPEQIPTIVKSLSFANPPTCVRTTLWSPYAALNETTYAWITTEEGTIHAVELGDYLKPAATPSPDDIDFTNFKIRVGENPVNMSYLRREMNSSGAEQFGQKVYVVSRGTRKVQLVNLYTGQIEKEIQDSRIIDPVWVDDNEANGSTAVVMTIADYTGQKVHNIQDDVVVLNAQLVECQLPGALTDPKCMPRDGAGNHAEFEYSGGLACVGPVRAVLGSNVP